MVTFSKFKVNLKKCEHNLSSSEHDGLMSKEDKIILDSLAIANKSDAASNITINAPELDIINQEFELYNSQIEVNSKKIERLNSLIESQGYCGRVWDESSSSPTAKTYCGNLDMLRNLPNILGLGCYLVQNDHTRRKLSPTNHYKFADDNSEAKLDGSMGHYQWGWNKPFYITTWSENNLFYECISFEPIKGREGYYVPVGSMSASGFAAIDRETNTLVSYINNSTKYRGGDNNAELDNNSIKTLLGRCVTNLTPAEFAEMARKNGTGWYAGTMRMYNVITILFHIIMGTRNSNTEFISEKDDRNLYQGGLGSGITDIENNIWKLLQYNPFLNLSIGVNEGDKLTVTNEQTINIDNNTIKFKIPIFFGLKNIFGYINRAIEDEYGLIDNDMNIVHAVRKSMYSEDYNYGSDNNAIYKLTVISQSLGLNYIKDISYKQLECFPKIYDNGSNSTYYTDTITFSNITLLYIRAICRGGHSLFDNQKAGLSTIILTDNVESMKFNSIGTFLCEFTEDFLLEPIKL